MENQEISGHRSDLKSMNMQQVEDTARSGTSIPAAVADENLYSKEVFDVQIIEDDQRVRKLVRKVDTRLVLILALLYVTAFLDRSNLGNAYIAGMDVDLSLTVQARYSIVTFIFFVGYIVIDIPAAYVVKILGASIWIPCMSMAWSILTIAQGFVHSWQALLVCRILLGFCEGCFTPAALYVFGTPAMRYAAFFVMGIASSGLSGLLAFGIEDMDGLAGIAGWRWIYIIEGIASAVVAILSLAFLMDLPEKAIKRNILGIPPCLTSEEAGILLARIDRDRGLSDTENYNLLELLRQLKDWKVWEYSFIVLANNVALYAFSYFLPNILRSGLGYSVSKAQIMTFPPYAVSVVWVMFIAWICDKLHSRGPAIIFNASLYIVGITMVGFCQNVNVRYAGVFLGVIGVCGNVPTNFGYQHNNTVGQAKRAICSAMMTTGGGISGIIAGNIFRSQDAPGYIPGLIVAICLQIITILIVVKNFYVFTRANRKADKGEKVLEGVPGFRYTL